METIELYFYSVDDGTDRLQQQQQRVFKGVDIGVIGHGRSKGPVDGRIDIQTSAVCNDIYHTRPNKQTLTV